MVFEFTNLNWVAVVAGAVAGFLVGGIWFAPQVLGRRWSAAAGVELPSMSNTSVVMWAIGGAGLPLLTAYVLTVVIKALGVASPVDGALVGFVVWLGFVAPTLLNPVIYERRGWEYWLINASFFLVASVLMGGLIGYLGA